MTDPEQSLVVDTEKTVSLSQQQKEQEGKQQQLAARANNPVKHSKRLVYFALSLAAVAVGTATYVLTSRSEQDDFESEVCYAWGPMLPFSSKREREREHSRKSHSPFSLDACSLATITV